MSDQLVALQSGSPESIDRDNSVRFHMSMNVGNLSASVSFFEKFFGCPPAKLRSDYAKFEVQHPPLVLSLEPSKPSGGGSLNHVGLRMPSTEALVAMQRRLESCGVGTQRMDGVECCYARQTKFWLHDPDGVLWEVYTLDEDIDHHGFSGDESSSTSDHDPSPTEHASDANAAELALAIWSHRLGQPIPSQLFVRDNSVDVIQLQGTLNATSDPAMRATLYQQCYRALKPSGKISLHQLTSDRPIQAAQLQLPGAASVVEQVLPIDQLMDELRSAGLSQIEFDKYGQRPCFLRDGIEMRETLLTARKAHPDATATEPDASITDCRVIYKGPADQVKVGGTTLQRGRVTEVSDHIRNQLKAALADQLIVFGDA